MPRTQRLLLSSTLALLLLLVPSAAAQWSADAATNLVVADGDAEQVQPKVVATPDGGVYVSWFEGTGYDVRIQKLDADGAEVFASGGLLVADRGFSSTQDYGLAVDPDGDALLAFRDDRSGGVDITATKVTADGTQPWGPTGVQLTNTSEFLGAPRIAAMPDGGAVVAWFQNGPARLQALDADGAVRWTDDVVLSPSAGFYFPSDLRADGTDVILSIVHQTGSGSAPKHLLAQKFDAAGTALWGTDPVAVFEGGSLQTGNFPTFTLDGSGGAVFSWYGVSPLQVYVQRILADGTEAFATDGLAVSEDPSRERVAPSAAFDPETGDLYVFWIELAAAQSQNGVFGQKVDADGIRRWASEGVAVLAIGSENVTVVQTVLAGDGASAFWIQSPGFGQDVVQGVNASGDAASGIDVNQFDVSTTPSEKSRLRATDTSSDFAVLAWQDARSGSPDIYAQNVFPNGSLGVLVAGEDGPETHSLSLRAWPVPSQGQVHFEAAADGRADADLTVYDVLGRRVWSRTVASGERVTWSGQSASGAPAAAGVYHARLSQSGRHRSLRFTIAR